MLKNFILNKKSIEDTYKMIREFHEKYLKRVSVKLPKLYGPRGNFTKDALVLAYLSYGYPNTREVSKQELQNLLEIIIQTQTMFNRQDIWVHKWDGG